MPDSLEVIGHFFNNFCFKTHINNNQILSKIQSNKAEKRIVVLSSALLVNHRGFEPRTP